MTKKHAQTAQSGAGGSQIDGSIRFYDKKIYYIQDVRNASRKFKWKSEFGLLLLKPIGALFHRKF
ncbi:MAG: hypothetical protein LBD58_00480 [Treponema sp.]|jgi:hypothetical protein|nr:hypothetical protein [Treponema sp.]